MAQEIDVTLKRNNGTDDDILLVTTRWSQVLEKPTEFTPTAHTHGNITDDGAIGSTADLAVITTTDGKLTTRSRSGIDTRTAFPVSGATSSTLGGIKISISGNTCTIVTT